LIGQCIACNAAFGKSNPSSNESSKFEDQGFYGTSKDGELIRVGRLNRLTALSAAEADGQGGVETPGPLSPSPNYATGRLQPPGHVLPTTTRSPTTFAIQFELDTHDL